MAALALLLPPSLGLRLSYLALLQPASQVSLAARGLPAPMLLALTISELP